MASAPKTLSAFQSLRSEHQELSRRVTRVCTLSSSAPHDPNALGGAVDVACDVLRVVERLASLEDGILFPYLTRWLDEYSASIRAARAQRTRLVSELRWFLRVAKPLPSDRTPREAARLESLASRVRREFDEWVVREEIGVFRCCEARLGSFSSRWLLGVIELDLARGSLPLRIDC